MTDLERVEAGERPARWHVTEGGVLLVQYDAYRAGWGWFPWPHGADALRNVPESK